MSGSNLFYDFDQHPYLRYVPEATRNLAYVGIATIAYVVLIFKSLEILGYPVWLWLHKFLEMAQKTVRFVIPYRASSFSRGSTSTNSDLGEDSPKAESAPGPLGNVLQTVFGLNGQSLMKGVKGVQAPFAKSASIVPPGLGNWDNSCYQNSVIQGLASLPALRHYFSWVISEFKSLDKSTTSGSLWDMINTLNNSENNGQRFWISGNLKAMSTWQQQDAQEYYSKILDSVDKEVLDAAKERGLRGPGWLQANSVLNEAPTVKEADEILKTPRSNDQSEHPEAPQIVPNPLDGLLAQRVGCLRCGYSEGLSLIPFNCITVPLGTYKYVYDVRDCLDEYTNMETIEGVDCPKCTLLHTKTTLSKLIESGVSTPAMAARLQAVNEALEDDDFEDSTLIKKCSTPKKNWSKSTKSRQAVIARAPKALVIHVNRSVFNELTGEQMKNTTNVQFPKDLDLGSWCLGTSPSQTKKPDESVEEWSRNPNQSMLASPEVEAVSDSPFQYALRAVVTHFGRHENGHYVCFRKHPVEPTANADKVTQSSEPTASEDPPASELPISTQDDSEQSAQTKERWWRLSDADVYESTEDNVLNQGGVFMLFYERIDVPSPTTLSMASSVEPVSNFISKDAPADRIDAATSSHDAAIEAHLPDDETDASFLPDLPKAKAKQSIEDSTSSKRPERAYSTPPPESPTTVTTSEHCPSETGSTTNDDEDALSTQSTQLTSDDDVERDTKQEQKQSVPASPQMMRTAGDSPARRGQGGRKSLPMVAAT